VACVVLTHFTDENFIGSTANDEVCRSDAHPAFGAVEIEHALVPFFNLNYNVMSLCIFVVYATDFLFAQWAFAF